MSDAQSFQLTQQQVDFFHLFGYLHLPGLFSAEAELLQNKFDELFAEHQQDIFEWDALDYSRQVLMPFMDRDEQLIKLLTGDRVFGVMQSLLGDDFLYRNSDGDVYHGGTYWHGDSLGMPIDYTFIKMGLYLEPLTANSGALRVLPGTHHIGDAYANEIHQQVTKNNGVVLGMDDSAVPGVVLETKPGDAVLFNFDCKHATCNHTFPRRMICMNFSSAYGDEGKDKLAHEVDVIMSTLKLSNIYGRRLVENLNPDKMRHLQPVIDCGGYNAEDT